MVTSILKVLLRQYMSPTENFKEASVLSWNQFIYQTSNQYLKRLQRKVRKTKFLQKAITPVKVGQAWWNSNLICIMSMPIHLSNISNQYLKRLQRKVWKSKFQQRAITPVKVGQAKQNSNLICIMSMPIHISNVKSISQKTTEKSLEN